MATSLKEHARFNARLPKEQKQLFEKAAYLGGFRNLTDFIMQSANEKAKKIIEDRDQIIASERDGQLFFDAITNAKAPSDTLNQALNDYNAFIANSK